MANFYYYDHNGRKIGPMNNAQLKALAMQGIIVPDTQLEADTGHTGKAGQINGLFAAVPPQPVSVPPLGNAAPASKDSESLWRWRIWVGAGAGAATAALIKFLLTYR
jgi:hypothetical protein